MTYPLLIAETPNAGKWGYRFLVSDDSTIDDDKVTDFVRRGRTGSHVVGGNYIAVRHEVIQHSTGRPGANETLVLVGVDTARLTKQKQEQVIATLRSLLPEIDMAVQETDWSTEKRLSVPNKTLSKWVSEAFLSLPVADIEGPQNRMPPPPCCEISYRKIIVAIALSLVTSIGLVVFGLVVYNSTNTSQQASRVSYGDEKHEESAKKPDDINMGQKSNDPQDKRKQQANDKYLNKIFDDYVRKPIDLTNPDSLLNGCDLKHFPYPDSATENQKQRCKQYREKIQRKIKKAKEEWEKFVAEHNRLLSVDNFKGAKIHFLDWKAGNEQELNKLREDYECVLDKYVNEKIASNNFTYLRTVVMELSALDVIEDDFLRSIRNKLVNAEDECLYNKIILSKTHLDKMNCAKKYLDSEVSEENRRMRTPVKEWLEYFDTERELTFIVTNIYWDKFWSSKKPVSATVELVSITSDESERPRYGPKQYSVTVKHEGKQDLCKFSSVKVKLSSSITIKLKAKNSPNSVSYSYTIIDLGTAPPKGSVNLKFDQKNHKKSEIKIDYEIQGIPVKPSLPDEWSKN